MPETEVVSSWVVSRRKRVMDLIVAALLSLLAVVSISLLSPVVWVSSRAGPLFRQKRIGQRGTPFMFLKLRTMRPDSGTHVTTAEDPRVTSLGRLLRRTKLDEIPQVLHVLRGQMSLVGPRPDVPGYLDLLPDDEILHELRPGVTGLASVAFRDEEWLLAKTHDATALNDEILWPSKCELNRFYAAHATLACDVALLLRTVAPWWPLRRCCATAASDVRARVGREVDVQQRRLEGGRDLGGRGPS